MLQASQRTALSGPALIRLLARLAEVDVPESRQSLSDRLSQWLGWTDAIALSTALSGGQAVAAGGRAASATQGGVGAGSQGGTPRGGSGGAQAAVQPSAQPNAQPTAHANPHEAEAARVRTSLVKAVAGDSLLAPTRQRRIGQALPPGVAPDATADFALFRQRYASIQQSMETAVGTLRGRLRSALAATSPASAQLAVLDAVMERAMAERERTLLATVPGLLSAHFERLRRAEEARQASSEPDAIVNAESDAEAENNAGTVAKSDPERAAPPQTPVAREPAVATAAAWLDVFRKDMQSVLLAELDVRFQPVEGLLDALRAC